MPFQWGFKNPRPRYIWAGFTWVRNAFTLATKKAARFYFVTRVTHVTRSRHEYGHAGHAGHDELLVARKALRVTSS